MLDGTGSRVRGIDCWFRGVAGWLIGRNGADEIACHFSAVGFVLLGWRGVGEVDDIVLTGSTVKLC